MSVTRVSGDGAPIVLCGAACNIRCRSEMQYCPRRAFIFACLRAPLPREPCVPGLYRPRATTLRAAVEMSESVAGRKKKKKKSEVDCCATKSPCGGWIGRGGGTRIEENQFRLRSRAEPKSGGGFRLAKLSDAEDGSQATALVVWSGFYPAAKSSYDVHLFLDACHVHLTRPK